MAESSNRYSRFYALLNNMRFGYAGLKEEFKERIVRQVTKGRTGSLREMTEAEYGKMCDDLERLQDKITRESRENMKRYRSSALHQLQLYGVDTTDWGKVNAFCIQPRIAGKAFRDMDSRELDALTRNMRAIISKRDKEELSEGGEA